MPTYNSAAVSDTTIAFEKPITLQQGRALRDNPLAVLEGATNAPYQEHIWHPYDSTLVGDGNDGLLWSFAASGTVATIVTPDFADGYEYRIRFDGVRTSAGSGNLQIELYGETSAAYSGTPATIGTATSAVSESGFIELARPRSSGTYILSRSIYGSTGGSNPILVSSGADKALRARLSISGPLNFGLGSVYMDRRKLYA